MDRSLHTALGTGIEETPRDEEAASVVVLENLQNQRYPPWPQQTQPTALGAPYAEQVDSDGRRYIKLPHLNPLDLYFLYNPDKYYR